MYKVIQVTNFVSITSTKEDIRISGLAFRHLEFQSHATYNTASQYAPMTRASSKIYAYIAVGMFWPSFIEAMIQLYPVRNCHFEFLTSGFNMEPF